MKKRLLSAILALGIILSIVPMNTFAQIENPTENSNTTVCENHKTHDENCGFVESDPASVCTHECEICKQVSSFSVDAISPLTNSPVVLADHSHCICGGTTNVGRHRSHSDITYTSLSSSYTGGYLSAGNYYLSSDVTLTSSVRISTAADVNICLNGHTINANGGRYSVIINEGNLNICDCDVNHAGSIIGGNAEYYGGGIYNRSNLTFFGGNITGNTARITDGSYDMGCGGGIASEGFLALYGGNITGNTAGAAGAGVFIRRSSGTQNSAFFMAGNPEVFNNVDSSYKGNIRLDENCVIGIDGPLSNENPYGVTMWTPGVFTFTDADIIVPSDYFSSFKSDDPGYRMIITDRNLAFEEIPPAPVPVAPTTCTITAIAGTGGHFSTSQYVQVNMGDSAGFTITPEKGYKISDVTVDGKSIGAVKYYVFTNVVENHTIQAKFARLNGHSNPNTGVG